MSARDEVIACSGVLVGRYWVRWLGAQDPSCIRSDAGSTIRKLNRIGNPIVVEVRRFGIDGCPPRYLVRVVGQAGYFPLHEFEWHSNE